MKAVILAAGIASRLRPLTDNCPKCLLEVGSKCLLERTINALTENGINDIIIVTGYLNEMIETFVNTHFPDLKVSFIYNKFYETTNNIYSLWLTENQIINEDILLLDSDILFDPAIVDALLKSEHKNCLALNVHELGEEEIKVIIDSEKRIKEISKTCSIELAAGESIGIEKMSDEFIKPLFRELNIMINERGESNVFYEKAFENIINNGAVIYAINTTNFFSMELDTVEDFENACDKIPLALR